MQTVAAITESIDDILGTLVGCSRVQTDLQKLEVMPAGASRRK